MNQQKTVNAEASELSKFDQFANQWWDADGEMKALHDINPLRLSYIDRRCRLAGKKVLDVGCGGGILSEAMAASGAQVTGIDLAEQTLKVARLHLHESRHSIDYRLSAVEDMAATDAHAFDVVTCMELLEHVPDPMSVVSACATLVKPGGSVLFATLNRNPKSFLFAIIGAEHVLKLLPAGTHDWRRFIRPSELDRYARAADLTAEDTTGLHYNPLLRSFSLGPNVDVNYMMHCRAPAPDGESGRKK